MTERVQEGRGIIIVGLVMGVVAELKYALKLNETYVRVGDDLVVQHQKIGGRVIHVVEDALGVRPRID